MSPGGILSRRRPGASEDKAGPRPGLQLPTLMRGAEPLFQWLMDTAADTKELESQVLATLLDIKDQDAKILEATVDSFVQLTNIFELLDQQRDASAPTEPDGGRAAETESRGKTPAPPKLLEDPAEGPENAGKDPPSGVEGADDPATPPPLELGKDGLPKTISEDP